MIDLTDQVALITGGGRGIGLAVAARFRRGGAKVGIVDKLGVDEAVQSLGGSGAEVAGASADVTDADEVQRAVDAVEEALGPVDILVNNAGVTRDGLLARMTEDQWDLVLAVNLKGAFTMTKCVSRGMMKRRRGRIINIASVVGLIGNRGQANYAASKAGLIGFTKSVAKELAARNVLCNAIAPGFIDTDMTRNLPEEARAALMAQIPMGRLGSADDVASAVLFLASDLADYITGQVVVVDGGMVM